MKDNKKLIPSPLNYTGGKFKLLPQILPYFPNQIDTFVDLFCGGCNVGINVEAARHLYTDNNHALIGLFLMLQKLGADELISRIEQLISQYDLSDTRTKGYDFYNCNSCDGLSHYNRAGFLQLRDAFNSGGIHDDDYYIKLYTLIIFSFNNQIRFNASGEFNLPPGKRDFNQRMRVKLIDFMKALKSQNALFQTLDYLNFDIHILSERDFVYVDPPYLITCASYNEQGGWTEIDERNLLHFLDRLHINNIKFALSNVLEAKGNTNMVLKDWINAHPDYRVIDLRYTYHNANYQRKSKDALTREILIVNY